jgi:peptide/nickel transport system ATP-binding protein/oligopeptide transport system ATP-binding protein
MTALLVVSEVSKRFRRSRREPDTVAVDNVSFELGEGSTLALVGESGAGKSTLGRLVLRLIEPDSGTVLLDGVDVRSLSPSELRLRRRDMQMVFQDPFTSLDPRYTVRRSVAEPLEVHTRLNRADRDAQVRRKLEMVGLGANYLDRAPHQLSGGELQRVAIARALVLEPKLIVCDEPVAALDVSIRAQILNLLLDIQSETKVSFLFITHDLSTVRLIATDVAVMRRGRIVEQGPPHEVLVNPTNPYTRELLAAIPSGSAALDRAETPPVDDRAQSPAPG